MIEIDGSHGEGGGQVVRTSLSLAAVTGQAVEIVNVRAGRTKPGLQPQHLAAVRAAAALCCAELEGDRVGAGRLVFRPRSPVCPGAYRFDIGTAGAATLVAQTVLVPLAHAGAPSAVALTGGTHVPHAPPGEYLRDVYLPAVAAVGCEARFSMGRAGFYPRGGGEVSLNVRPATAAGPLALVERGALVTLTATIVTANLPEHVGARGAAVVEAFFRGIGRRVEVVRQVVESPGTGAAVVIVAACEAGRAGFTGLGERGKPMEKVASEACGQFLPWWRSGAACDEHLADQLVLPLALTPGESCWTTPRVTEHLRTVLWVAERLLPVSHTIEQPPDGPAVVRLRSAK